MPSALQQSRHLLAQAVARVRRGASDYSRALDQPGPPISVEPFDARNVSTPAALVKLGTSIAAERRRRANYDEAKRTAELGAEEKRAHIALLRAQASYNLGEGRQPAAKSTEITPYQQAQLDLAKKRLDLSRQSHTDLNDRIGKTAAAQAQLRQLDERIKREAEIAASGDVSGYERAFGFLRSPDPAQRERAARLVGIDPATWEAAVSKYPGDIPKLIESAKKGLADASLRRNTAAITARYEPLRRQYQDVLDQGTVGFSGPQIQDYVPDENGNYVPAGE